MNMIEQELIDKIKELKQVKPRKEWVVLTKNFIFTSSEKEEKARDFSFIAFLKGLQKGERFVFQHKPAFAVLTTFLVLIGLFGISQNSVPGDFLFSFKKISEQGQIFFVSEENYTKYSLETLNKRLDELEKIVQTNQSRKLASALDEYQQTISKTAEDLNKAVSKNQNQNQNLKEIVAEVKKVEDKTKLLKSLGVEGVGGDEKWDNTLSSIVQREIEDLEEKNLTDEQKEILNEIKVNYKEGNYSQALEKILFLTNN